MIDWISECPRELAEWVVWCWPGGEKKPAVKYYYDTQAKAESQAQRLNEQIGEGSARAGRLRRAGNGETDVVWGYNAHLPS
jgi:hypothetical protein